MPPVLIMPATACKIPLFPFALKRTAAWKVINSKPFSWLVRLKSNIILIDFKGLYSGGIFYLKLFIVCLAMAFYSIWG